MKRILRTWLRLAFYLHNKSNVEHVFCHFSPISDFLQAFFITTIVPSEENNFFQSSFVQFFFSWQKSIRIFLLAGLIKLFFLNIHFSKPITSSLISNSNLRKFLGSVYGIQYTLNTVYILLSHIIYIQSRYRIIW